MANEIKLEGRHRFRHVWRAACPGPGKRHLQRSGTRSERRTCGAMTRVALFAQVDQRGTVREIFGVKVPAFGFERTADCLQRPVGRPPRRLGGAACTSATWC